MVPFFGTSPLITIADMKLHAFSSDDVIIALMGMTGAGKSSFISLCSDKKPAIGHDLNSCTQSVDIYTFLYDGPPRKRIFLVDTPGFDDSTRSDAEVLRELAAWLTATYAMEIRLSGIIYLHRINQPRMQGSAKRNIIMFKKLCGDGALKNVILATTMWDLVGDDDGVAREKQLVDTKEFWGYMASKGSNVYRHNNTRESVLKLIGHFVKADSKTTLDIQEEMVNQHKPLDGTAAAATVEAKLEEERSRFVTELRNLEIDLRDALRSKDNDMMEMLRESRAEYKAELAQVQAAQDSLRTSMEKLHRDRYAQLEEAMKEQQRAHETQLAAASKSQTSTNYIAPPVYTPRPSPSRPSPSRPSSSPLASGSYDKTVKIWDPAAGQSTQTFESHYDAVNSVAWSHDGWRLASGSCNGDIKIWDPTDGYDSIKEFRPPELFHGHNVFAVTWSPDGTQLASAEQGMINIWDVGKSIRCRRTLRDHTRTVNSVAWSNDGMRLASGSYDHTIKIWDPATGRCQLKLDDHHAVVLSVAWSHDSRRLASGGGDSAMKIWDPATGQCVSTVDTRPWQYPFGGSVESVAWSRDGTRIAVGCNEKIGIWDPAADQCVLRLGNYGHNDYVNDGVFRGVNSVAWSSDGRQLASGCSDNAIRIWDLVAGKLLSTLQGHQGPVRSVAWL